MSSNGLHQAEDTGSAAAEDVELAGALAAFVESREGGTPIPVEQLIREHPRIADRLRTCLASLQAVEQAVGQFQTASGEAEPKELGLLGDFRLHREVGRGGMGIVYEAEQLSLRRRVALKVLPFAATMDPHQIQRFHNEARAAASLEHPHIVPVYGVGQERGVHFYAMKFIDGQSLAQLIARREAPGSGDLTKPYLTVGPSDDTAPRAADTTGPPRDGGFFRQVAGWGAQAADALEHAHSLGIVHRDVKPANLLIDSQGTLWVADFGLARTATDSGLTMTGDVVGTLRYMSPEQALAKHNLVDHRADVYALGATLYELLTGRPAVEGRDRAELLHSIAIEEPKAPRRHDRAIPADLETVVLKALAKEPGERYLSAGALAEDLRRFLDDRPILSRPPTTAQRVVRWARRHPGHVRATAALLAVVLAGLAASSLLFWHKEREAVALLDEKSKALRRAEQAQYTLRVALADRDLGSGELERARRGLDNCPPELRGWEWHYLRRATVAPPAREKGFEARAISPGGRFLATHPTGSSQGDRLELRDAMAGRVLWAAYTGTAVTFGPDGELVAAATGGEADGFIRVWESATGKQVAALPAPPRDAVHALAFSPDGSRLVIASHREAAVWDLTHTRRLAAWPGGARAVAFSPDGKDLALAVGDEVVVRDLSTGKGRLTLRGYHGPVQSVAYSPDGRRLATAGPKQRVRVFQAASGKETRSLNARDDRIHTLQFSPDGHHLLAVGLTRSTVWLGQGSDDGEVIHWALAPAVFTKPGHLAVGVGRRVERADLNKAGGALTVLDEQNPPYCLAFSPDNTHLVVGCQSGQVLIRDRADGHVVRTLPGHTDGVVMAVAFSPDGRLVASVDGIGKLRVSEAATGRAVHSLTAHPMPAFAVAFSPNGRQLASAGSEGAVRLWDVATGKEMQTFEHPDACFALAFSPDGQRLAVGGRGGRVHPDKLRVYDLASRRLLFARASLHNTIPRVRYSPDGRRIAWSHGGGKVEVCDAESGQEILSVRGDQVVFSPDGSRLATGDGAATVRLWDAASGAELVRLRAHTHLLDLSFSSDGQVLGSVGFESLLRLWDGSPAE